jgi:serine protease AprX
VLGVKFRGIAAVALGASLLSVAGAKAGADTTSMPVIVRAAGSLSAAEATVAAAGGTVGRELRIINGFSAHLPKDAVAKVAAQDAVAAVTRDGSVTFAGTTPPYSAGKDTGSLFNIVRSMSVNQLWNQHYSGQGIGVALIDSGVTPVPGLTAGNVIDGPDLSLDAGTPSLRSLDDFGHGTHLAGIIAGRDSTAQNYTAYNDPSKFTGVAPDATLVNVKVGAANGAVDVSQVIAALDWVVAHKDDPGINIRVVNLSFGTDSTQAYQVDPLVYAAEAAWRAGLVVVAAAGNEGNTVSTLTDPATDPYVIAVGADGHYDKDGHKQYISSFSNAGSPGRHPDVVAPGQSTTSLRDPGSFADTLYPGGRVGDPAGRFFRGSGTSQSAAVVTGVVADLLSKYPTMTPDQVKGTLMQYALPLAGVDPALQGAGEVNASKFPGLKTNGMPSYAQSWEPSDGSGSIEASRGSSHLTNSNGDVLSGETTVFGAAFDGHSWTDNAWDAASWEGGSWTGHSWTGHSWTGDTWTGHSWTTDQWAGHSWTDDSWDGHSWTGDSWTGHSWTDDTWTGHSWTGTTWG